MKTTKPEKISKPYLAVIVLLMLVFPIVSIAIEYPVAKEHAFHSDNTLFFITGKWFAFWAIGVRLFTAGLKQVFNPAFTAQSIFKLKSTDANVVVKELGFANICLGLVGISVLIDPFFFYITYLSGGLYMGIAGINHIIKKPAGINEYVAMVSDIFIFLIAVFYLGCFFFAI